MTPDLVYLSTPSTKGELLYSLRSVERFGDGFGKIVIVGYLPPNIIPDIHIPHSNTKRQYKSRDMFEKINLVCQNKEVAESFIRMSDDYFFSDLIDFYSMPTYIREFDLIEHGKKAPHNKNNMVATETAKALKSKGLPIISYDLHTPMKMEKTKFRQIAKSFNWTNPLSLAIRSIYGNYHKIPGVVRKDIKFTRYYDFEMVSKEPIWSTGEQFWCNKTMERMYPNKSRWEI